MNMLAKRFLSGVLCGALLFACSGCVSAPADGPQDPPPAEEQKLELLTVYGGDTVDLCPPLLRQYLEEDDFDAQCAFLLEHEGENFDYQNISFAWEEDGSELYSVYFSKDASFTHSYVVQTEENSLSGGFFAAGQTYYWKVESEFANSETDHFYTDDELGGLAKVYDRAKRTEADVVTVRAAASVFEGKEYSGKWTAAEHSFTKAPVFEAKDTGGRGFLFCHGWMGDKLFRVDFLREKGLHFSAVRAFESVPFVFTAILLGKNTVCEAALYTQELQCIKYQKNPNIALIDCQIVMLMLEERLKAYGLFDAYEKAFRTWCIEFAVWFYQTIKGEEKEKFRHILKGNIEPWLKVTEGGRYFTVKRLYKYCELCSEDDEKTVQRKIKAYDSAKTIISIWGCCVSRQFLNLEPDAFYVNGYMFQNPIHLTYDGLPISKNKIPFSVFESVKTYGIWQKSSYLNFNRNVLDYFKTHKADYLLIDIADIRFERYRCVEREDGLRSWLVDGKHVEACLDECLKRGINIKIENITYNFFKNREHIISKESWYRIVSKFVADIKQLYDVDKVIFNRVVCSEQYAENYVLIPFENDIRKYNILIPEVEELILNNLQGCHVIPASKNVYADAKHSLGLSPMHYCKTYEEYKMKALKKIVYEHASNAEIQTLCDEYDKKLVYELESLTKQE